MKMKYEIMCAGYKGIKRENYKPINEDEIWNLCAGYKDRKSELGKWKQSSISLLMGFLSLEN